MEGYRDCGGKPMSSAVLRITQLPTRYEPLVRVLGNKAKTTFVPCGDDLAAAKRLLASADSAGQGKICFLEAPSGSGKSTFVHGLEIFTADKVGQVVRLPPAHELTLSTIPAYVAALPSHTKKTVVNFDGREAPSFNRSEYQTFLGELNGVLRSRPDLLIYWPVIDSKFAQELVALLEKVGGGSAFGPQRIHKMQGLKREQYSRGLTTVKRSRVDLVLSKIGPRGSRAPYPIAISGGKEHKATDEASETEAAIEMAYRQVVATPSDSSEFHCDSNWHLRRSELRRPSP
jgi:hypothetical protein